MGRRDSLPREACEIVAPSTALLAGRTRGATRKSHAPGALPSANPAPKVTTTAKPCPRDTVQAFLAPKGATKRKSTPRAQF